jgi:hypothetical protein
MLPTEDMAHVQKCFRHTNDTLLAESESLTPLITGYDPEAVPFLLIHMYLLVCWCFIRRSVKVRVTDAYNVYLVWNVSELQDYNPRPKLAAHQAESTFYLVVFQNSWDIQVSLLTGRKMFNSCNSWRARTHFIYKQCKDQGYDSVFFLTSSWNILHTCRNLFIWLDLTIEQSYVRSNPCEICGG